MKRNAEFRMQNADCLNSEFSILNSTLWIQIS
jgi:hypothetical protein